MKAIWFLLLLPFLLTSAHAAPQVLDSGPRQVTLLELYTSQGCSSCPPAERWLNEYVADEDLWTAIVPLALHVDYWDYIGWKDPYARPEHGRRQRAYERSGLARSVYTPGVFVNGREWRGWTRGLPPGASDALPGNLRVQIEASLITAAFPSSDESLELHVVVLGFGIETHVLRGENSNRTLRQEFVVLDHAVHSTTDGRWTVPRPALPAEADRYAIVFWVSSAGEPRPLQATGAWLSRSE
ncbi:MAG: DUF1223 domain-containing protein [Pseudomonadota bacterium]